MANVKKLIVYNSDTSTEVFTIINLTEGTTNFLREDGSLALPPSSGPSNVSTVKTSSLAFSTTTSSLPLTGLAFNVVSASSYAFEFAVAFATAISTTGLKLGLEFPSVSTFAATVRIPIAAAGVGGEYQGWVTSSGGVVTGTAVLTSSTKYMAFATGVIVPSASGVLQLTYGTEVAGSAVSTFAGSYGRLTTV